MTRLMRVFLYLAEREDLVRTLYSTNRLERLAPPLAPEGART
jgi:hypothetical protein